MTKSILLSQGKVSIVDDADFEYLHQWKWYAHRDTHTWYAQRGARTTIKMHRLITNAPKGMQVDHINGDGLDNRRKNLRVCTNSENMCNTKLYNTNTTGYKGVIAYNNKFRAVLEHQGKKHRLGVFTNTIDAARAYDKAAREFFGEFARTNFEATS